MTLKDDFAELAKTQPHLQTPVVVDCEEVYANMKLNEANILSFNQLNYCTRTAVGYVEADDTIVDFPIHVHCNRTALLKGFY